MSDGLTEWAREEQEVRKVPKVPVVCTKKHHSLYIVFDAVMEQVNSGKGEERHGKGLDFMDQPWYSIARTHGIGFLTGQAAKKLDEAQGMSGEAWEREMLGVIAYAAMAILYHRESR